MPRIIAGRAGGRRLAAPPRQTRPTSDRVREAIFSAVQARRDLDGARVLDLYAGSGALGLEALSRGAAHVRFVEADRRVAAVLRRNVETIGLPGAVVSVGDVTAVLSEDPDTTYDMVLADPPYELAAAALDGVLAALTRRQWLAPAALVVVERRSTTAPPGWPDGVVVLTHRRYGDTTVHYGSAI